MPELLHSEVRCPDCEWVQTYKGRLGWAVEGVAQEALREHRQGAHRDGDPRG